MISTVVDYNLWKAVISGPRITTSVVDGITVEESPKHWDENDKKKLSIDAKAVNNLYCVLSAEKVDKISLFTSAKRIWDTLEVTHKGTNQVKE